VELAPESMLVVSELVLVSEVVPASDVLALESVGADVSGAGEESVLAVDPTKGIWSANGTWSAAKAPAAPTATTASAIANVAALRRCDRKRRSAPSFACLFRSLNFGSLFVAELSPAGVSDSTKLSPHFLPLPQPHGNAAMRAVPSIACLEAAFNRSYGSSELAQWLTMRIGRSLRSRALETESACTQGFPTLIDVSQLASGCSPHLGSGPAAQPAHGCAPAVSLDRGLRHRHRPVSLAPPRRMVLRSRFAVVVRSAFLVSLPVPFCSHRTYAEEANARTFGVQQSAMSSLRH
jgi:hypothetical protein